MGRASGDMCKVAIGKYFTYKYTKGLTRFGMGVFLTSYKWKKAGVNVISLVWYSILTFQIQWINIDIRLSGGVLIDIRRKKGDILPIIISILIYYFRHCFKRSEINHFLCPLIEARPSHACTCTCIAFVKLSCVSAPLTILIISKYNLISLT